MKQTIDYTQLNVDTRKFPVVEYEGRCEEYEDPADYSPREMVRAGVIV